VAISVLSIVSMIAWRGLGSLIHTRERLEPERDEVRALLTVFGQMERDLAQIATPGMFALQMSPVAVRQAGGSVVMEVVRVAPAAANSAASALQTIYYRVDEGVLIRQASTPTREHGAAGSQEAQLSTAQMLKEVKSLRVRVWREVGWVDPVGAGEAPPQAVPPGTPGASIPVPPGLEVVVERNDGRLFRRVLLVG
jgi:general secretion pathway protein J